MRDFLRTKRDVIREAYEKGNVPGGQDPGFPADRQRVLDFLNNL
jgi:hypothetical protein